MRSDAGSWVQESEGLRTLPRKSNSQVIATLNEYRHRSLRAIDNARFSWIHVRICFIVGAGFFTNAYDIFAINIMVSMLGYVYGDQNGDLTSWQSTALKVAAPVGSFVGQLLLGCLSDILGRKRMYGAEIVLMVAATFGQALTGFANALDIISVLVLWRFVMGIGCGGDYPLSAIFMSEFAPVQIRGRLMTAIFTCQGWGQLAVGLVGLIIVVAYGDTIRNADYPATLPVDHTWRLLVGFGCIPGLVAFYFRFTVPESPRFTMDIERNITRATRDINNVVLVNRCLATQDVVGDRTFTAPRASFADFITHFSKWKNLKVLVGTAYSRFALCIPFYSLTLNNSAILTYCNFGKLNGNRSDDVYKSLLRVCYGNLVLTIAGFLPGFWVSFLFIDSWGRKPIQLMGFTVLTVLFLTMAFAYVPLNATRAGQNAFIFLYCLANFFQNFGPNTTTFIVPGEAFPTRYRSTAYGISVACGQIGAIIAQLALGRPLLHTVEAVQTVLEILSFVMFTGVLSTLLLPETKQRTLEDVSNESQESYITSTVERGIPLYP